MRLREFCFYFGLFAILPLAAQEPLPAKVPFRFASLGRDVLLRDLAPALPGRRANLPPGGEELALQATTFTPYDRYFANVRAVIAALDAARATMPQACHLMKVGYSFQYVTRDPYRPDPPELTALQRAGDCKSKALWLFENLGDSSALFVIGKAERTSRTSHAWVYWRQGGRWWILDCTDRTDPIAADSVSAERYVPYYSFGKSGVFRHPSTCLNLPEPRNGKLAAAAVGASPGKKSR